MRSSVSSFISFNKQFASERMDPPQAKKRRGPPMKEPGEDRSATGVSPSLLVHMMEIETNSSNVEHE